MLCTLAFLPTNLINCFVALCPETRNNFNADADDLLEYFMNTCIGRFFEIALYSDPLLFINLWNMFNKTDQELPWINNSIEGWHQNFQGHLSACHPNFWEFINVLKKKEAYVRVSILQHEGGDSVQPKILRVVDDYPNRQILHYFRNIAQYLAFWLLQIHFA